MSAAHRMARMSRLVRFCIVVGCSALLIGVVAAWVIGGRLVAPARAEIGAPPAELNGVSIELQSDSGEIIRGWHLVNVDSRSVVVLTHGIRGNRRAMLPRARELFRRGYSVVMIDLQAHGETPGTNITLGHLERHDVAAAVSYARREHPSEGIGVIGVSLGGASALLASPMGLDALILEAVFPSISAAVHNRVSAQLGPFSWLPASLLLLQLQPRLGVAPANLRPIDHIPNIGCPVFIVSGVEDQHTTVDEAKQMFDAAVEPKQMWLVPNAAHVDLHQAAPAEYESKVIEFLAGHMKGR